ncbi:MAG: EpsG family protein [Bacteroidetes bacterium]|nr:EpsG family protein [Bacteroidota bacterium]
MIQTLIIGLICVFLAYFSKNRNNKYSFECAFILLTCFLAIRYDWGNDYHDYLLIFKEIGSSGLNLFDWSSLKDYYSNGEFGWAFLNILFKPFGFFAMVAVLTIFEQFVIYKFIKKHVPIKWYWLALLLYIFGPSHMLIGLSMMRQYLAMTLYLIAIDFIYSKKFIPFILIILLASTMHLSALILLPTYFLRYLINIKINKKTLVTLTLLYVIWFFYAPSFFSNILSNILSLPLFHAYEYYVPAKLTGLENIGLGFLFNNVVLITLLYKLSVQSAKIRLLFILSIISFLIVPLQTIAPLVGRIGYYFGLLTIVCYPSLIQSIKNKYYKNGLLLGIILVNIKGFFDFFYSEIWYNDFLIYKTIFGAHHWM